MNVIAWVMLRELDPRAPFCGSSYMLSGIDSCNTAVNSWPFSCSMKLYDFMYNHPHLV